MKVMTFNLRVDVPVDGPNYWPFRVDSVAAMIRFHAPDIIGLQEVTDRMKLDLQPLFTDYLFLGDGRNADRHGEACTVMVLKNKFKPVQSRTFWLSATPEVAGSMDEEEGFPRICTEIGVIDNQTGNQFNVLNTHFAYRSERTRVQNAKTLLEDFAHQNKKVPTLLMGDFNAEDTHEIHQEILRHKFRNGFKELQQNHRKTFHGFLGGEGETAIDFIYATPEWTFSSIEVDDRKLLERYPSDHYPVIATLKLK